MTRTSKLIYDLNKVIQTLEPEIKAPNLFQPFKAELLLLSGSITKARQVYLEPIKNQVIRQKVLLDLATRLKLLENLNEEIRNKRQESITAFENFDQKTNQLFNILGSVLKSEKEMEGSIARNLL